MLHRWGLFRRAVRERRQQQQTSKRNRDGPSRQFAHAQRRGASRQTATGAGRIAVRRSDARVVRTRISRSREPSRRDLARALPLPSLATRHFARGRLHECCRVVVGIGSGRSQVHAEAERLVDDVLDHDDPDFVRVGLAEERDLRLGPFPLGAGVGPLEYVAGGARGGCATSRSGRTAENPLERRVVEQLVEDTNIQKS